MHKDKLLILLSLFFVLSVKAFSSTLNVYMTIPSQNDIGFPLSENIKVTFDMDIDMTTVDNTTFFVYSKASGYMAGTFSYDDESFTLTFTPDAEFRKADEIMVILTSNILTPAGDYLPNGFVWKFYTEISEEISGNIYHDANYPSGGYTGAITGGDFDNNGYIDIAASNDNDHNITVLKNNGFGQFGNSSAFNTGFTSGIECIIAANFDSHDNYIDLVVTCSAGDQFIVYEGLGNGDFVLHSAYNTGGNPRSICTGDFNADGALDIASANFDDDNITVYFNNGSGFFVGRSDYAVWTGPREILAHDIDNDGDIDLAVCNSTSQTVFIRWNDGNGYFYSSTQIPTIPTVGTGSGHSIFLGDIDFDYNADMVVGVDGNIFRFLNQGSGDFSAGFDEFPGPNNFAEVILGADLDGDNDLDLVSADGYGNEITLFYNDALGGFDDFENISFPYPVPGIYCGDLDNDGGYDLAITNYTLSGYVSILKNAAKLTLISHAPDLHEGNLPAGVDIMLETNINLDPSSFTNNNFYLFSSYAGKYTFSVSQDLPSYTTIIDAGYSYNPGATITAVVTDGLTSIYGAPLVDPFILTFTIKSNENGGRFQLSEVYHPDTSSVYCHLIDVDGDWDLDMVTVANATNWIEVAENNGSGSFSDLSTYDAGTKLQSVYPADFDNDFDLDLVGTRWNSGGFVIYNDGHGSFSSPVSFTTGTWPTLPIAADFNCDGYYDIAIPNRDSKNISVILNTGGTSFGSPTLYSVAFEPNSIFAGDLNNDGDNDLAVACRDTISILFNRSDGIFSLERNMSTGEDQFGPRYIQGGDLNGDGFLDLVACNYFINVFLNDGDGLHYQKTAYYLGEDAQIMGTEIKDIDGDGDLDFTVAHNIYDNCKMVTYINDGSGTFSRGQTYSVDGHMVNSATVGDLNNDNYPDVVIAGFGDSEEIYDMSIFINCGPLNCGDVDGNCIVNILDVVYLINFKYRDGPPPVPLVSADVNSDEMVSILDVVYIINYKYKNGPSPICPPIS